MYGSVLVVGAGVAGMRTALDLANAGVQVVLIERETVIGGAMAARLSDEAETFHVASGVEIPKPSEVANHPNIESLTLAELTDLSGQPGHFTAKLRIGARFVTDACTRCNHCHAVCPVVVPNEFQSGLSFRKAIYTPFSGSVPSHYAINIHDCLNNPPNYLACQKCVEVCEDNAIHFDTALEKHVERHVSAVVLATGLRMRDASHLTKYGYGEHPDIVTTMEMEHLLTSSGPTGGFVEKLSKGVSPESVAFIMLDASRFSVGCAVAQADRIFDQEIKEIVVLHPSQTKEGDSFAAWWKATARNEVKLVEGDLDRITMNDDDTFRVRYKPAGTELFAAQDYDMIVFSVGVEPTTELEKLATTLGVELDETGFARLNRRNGDLTATSRAGVYAAGCVTGPKDILGSVAESRATSIHAMRHMDQRHTENRLELKIEAPKSQTGVMIEGRWLSENEVQNRLERIILALFDANSTSGS